MTQTPDTQSFSDAAPTAAAQNAVQPSPAARWFKKIRGGLLFGLGYLLSPLCWWNDLVFNLPIAYGFGYLVSRFNADGLVPGVIVGYWLSNVLGFLLMQTGVIDVVQSQSKPRDFKKELLTGLATSTAYTVLIVLLVKSNVLQLPELIAEDGSINLDPLLSWFGRNS